MNIVKLAAFSDGPNGGNPAGVVVTKDMPSTSEMQRMALEVGFSETVFAVPLDEEAHWRVRYFSPESEVPFCGHATIALGAALAKEHGPGTYSLVLNDTEISVQGVQEGSQFKAMLQSPRTEHHVLSEFELAKTLELFGLNQGHLSADIQPAKIHAGANHYLIPLASRTDLSQMSYDLAKGRSFMNERGVVTVMLVVAESDDLFHVRNAFASGGVLEDPATGAAAAAFAGYLRDSGYAKAGALTIIQGEDMGLKSIITAEFTDEAHSSIRVSGATRSMDQKGC
ncbi:PhzF family phenazine biosynthesis protein [Arenicella sp. 4NH20-0111]|uniref:PhzF family phenazine biosynthesis protein n=1 Tax=Arenicella sp. 4NH20-0111 TaxID=3127648 RepID=UPI00310B5BF8